MSAPVKVALAGISGYGGTYLESLLCDERAVEAQLVGVVDPMPERCAHIAELQARHVPVYSSLQALFSKTPVDLMMIATPIHLHSPQTCFALRQGANVLCEKPLAGTLDDALRMLQTQRSVTGFAAIGYQWSFSKAVQTLKRDIIAGVLGRPVRMKTIVIFPRSRGYFGRNDWAGRIRAADGEGVFDSPVNNATAHYLHNMFYLLGRTPETSAIPGSVQAELYRANAVENYDTAALRCLTECGTEILFYTSLAAPDRLGPQSLFEFENATVEYDAAGAGQFIVRFRDGRVVTYGNPNLDRNEKIWQCVDAVKTGASIACGIPAAMAHTLCVAAAQESVATIADFPQRLRRTIELEDDVMICVDGLQEGLTDCYERGILPTAHRDLDWAQPGTAVDLGQPEWSRRHKMAAVPYA